MYIITPYGILYIICNTYQLIHSNLKKRCRKGSMCHPFSVEMSGRGWNGWRWTWGSGAAALEKSMGGIMEVPCFKSDWLMVHCSASFLTVTIHIYTDIHIYIYIHMITYVCNIYIYIYKCVCLQGWIIKTSRHHVTTEWRDSFLE